MVTGWKRSTVKDISTIFGRIGFRGYTRDDIVEAYEGAISLSPSNLKDGKIDVSNSTFISWHKYNESPEIKLRNGDVVLVKTGSTYGKSAYVDNLKWATTLNPQIVVFKNIKLNNKLFAYFVQTPEFQKQIEATIVGGAIPTLSQNQVYQFEIIFPIDEEEQKCIAEALSDVDSMISSLEKLIAKKKAVKQGAMQELLTGKKRLPGFDGEWVKCTLDQVAKITMGQSPESRYYNESNGLPLIQGNADIKNRKTKTRFYTMCVTKKAYAGDIILTVRAPVGNVAKTLFDCCIGRGVCALSEANEFLYHYLVYIEPNWANLSAGSTFDSINSDTLSKTELAVPFDLKEQDAIASILSDMDNEIQALEQKLEKTRQIKQGMMQQLLTGKIRLV